VILEQKFGKYLYHIHTSNIGRFPKVAPRKPGVTPENSITAFKNNILDIIIINWGHAVT
jgi:hypothetical protein